MSHVWKEQCQLGLWIRTPEPRKHLFKMREKEKTVNHFGTNIAQGTSISQGSVWGTWLE